MQHKYCSFWLKVVSLCSFFSSDFLIRFFFFFKSNAKKEHLVTRCKQVDWSNTSEGYSFVAHNLKY